jgi:hypothetical protein
VTAIPVAFVPLALHEIDRLRHHLAQCDSPLCVELQAKLEAAQEEVASMPTETSGPDA